MAKKKKNKTLHIISTILLCIYMFLSLYLVYNVVILKVLPNKYLIPLLKIGRAPV